MQELCDLWRQLHALSKQRILALHAAADGGTNALAALSGTNSGAPVLDCMVIMLGDLNRARQRLFVDHHSQLNLMLTLRAPF